MKTRIDQLTVFGGAPALSQPLYVGRPNIGSQEAFIERVQEVFTRRWLTNNGPCVQEFERRVAALAGVRHCVATCNATLALQLAIRALDLSGEVIVPSFTFAATAHALQWLGLTPVFCDVDPRTHNLDPLRAERLINGRTSGILGVHLWGRAADTDALTAIARDHGLRLLFDAAHAFACSSQGRMIGNFGDAEVFSFHATKFLNSFEGGAVVTNDDAVAHRVRLMRNFGFEGQEEGAELGTNAKMVEICAAMGLTNLEHLEEFIQANHRNYSCYQRELSSVPGLRLAEYDEREKCNFNYIVLEVEDTAGITRDQLLAILQAENVAARRYFYPGCHRLEPYRSMPSPLPALPCTERLSRQVLVLPSGTAATPEDVSAVCGIIRLAMQNAAEIARRLRDAATKEHGLQAA